MFEALVFVCAASSAYEINYSSCIQLTDHWGPYASQENCDIRAKQIIKDVLIGDLNPLLFDMYRSMGIPIDQLYATGVCNKIAGEEI